MSKHVLYRFYSASGELLYIGITCNLPRRFDRHSDDKPWWTEVASVRVEHFDDRAAVLEAERLAVAAEKPRFNIRLQVPALANGPALQLRDPEVESESDDVKDATVGLWFHSVVAGEVEWQGQVIDRASTYGYQVQLYSWLDGSPTKKKLVTHEEIQGWRFYPTDALMRAADALSKVQYPPTQSIDCPRCDSVGEVFRPRASACGDFHVIWRRDGRIWIDQRVSARDVSDTDYGCGYCPRSAR